MIFIVLVLPSESGNLHPLVRLWPESGQVLDTLAASKHRVPHFVDLYEVFGLSFLLLNQLQHVLEVVVFV